MYQQSHSLQAVPGTYQNPPGYSVSFPRLLPPCGHTTAARQDNQKYSEKQERIDKKLYELEHTPEKEKEREKAQKEKEKAEKQKIREEKEKEIQEQIEKYTPFKTVEEAKGYYIYRLGWELNNNKLQSVDLLLCNSQNKLKDLHFKYKKGKIINAPFGTTEENFLHINRQKIYMLNDDDEQQQAIELFREIFGKDPFTGEDIVSEKEESEQINKL